MNLLQEMVADLLGKVGRGFKLVTGGREVTRGRRGPAGRRRSEGRPGDQGRRAEPSSDPMHAPASA